MIAFVWTLFRAEMRGFVFHLSWTLSYNRYLATSKIALGTLYYTGTQLFKPEKRPLLEEVSWYRLNYCGLLDPIVIFRIISDIFGSFLQTFKSRIDEMREAIQKNRQKKPFPSPLLPPSSSSRPKKVKVRRKSEEKGGNPESKSALLVTTSNLGGSSTPV